MTKKINRDIGFLLLIFGVIIAFFGCACRKTRGLFDPGELSGGYSGGTGISEAATDWYVGQGSHTVIKGKCPKKWPRKMQKGFPICRRPLY